MLLQERVSPCDCKFACQLIHTVSCSAVVAKAPRKSLGRASVTSPGTGKRKGKAAAGGGNPLKLWPTPKGQNGLRKFLGGEKCGGSSSASGSGCSSGSSESTEEYDNSEQTDEQELESTEPQSSEIETCSNPPSPSPMNLLEDITQLNSDSEED